MTASILVVDDDPQIRSLIQTKLEQLGYNVDCAEDGRTGLSKMLEGRYDLLILDIMMPEQDGLEVIMELKARNVNIKVLAISAPGNSVFLNVAKGLGATKILPKPFRLETLQSNVEELLSVLS